MVRFWRSANDVLTCLMSGSKAPSVRVILPIWVEADHDVFTDRCKDDRHHFRFMRLQLLGVASISLSMRVRWRRLWRDVAQEWNQRRGNDKRDHNHQERIGVGHGGGLAIGHCQSCFSATA